ncbi:cold shock domain-containing protein [Leptobacterium flavescens]|uniref:Cold shock domain-containing protein n=1 Tax=Leptobacterium flavescens TaxID=472055 RepID=A0A6P0URX8_9FLAO|nr:cold shock domain-containing protein [Leptobacterium flavescens]NER13623.1 cold shock domain-containing protein [Leptobacterium flavescens]
MAKSQQSFGKKEREKKRQKKREEKQLKKEQRKANPKSSLDDMIAYVDEYGFATDTPPDLSNKEEIDPSTIQLGVPKREEEEEDPVKKGKVAFFNDSKGYGFIQEQETGEKYFVHINGTLEDIRENDKVSFELEQGKKGLNAVRVKKI